MGKLYVITGASGLVGTNLIKKLCESKTNFTILAVSNKHKVLINDKRVVEVNADVRDITSLEPIFNKVGYSQKICIHCAGIITISSKNSKEVYDVNVKGTKNISKMCIRHNFDKMIYVSSVHVLEDLPINKIIKEQVAFDETKVDGIYAKTKAQATQYVFNSCKKGLKAIVVHPSGIIGPYDFNKGNFTTLIEMYLKGKLPAIVKGGYDFVDVRDVVDGIIGAIKKGKIGECYILSNRYYSIRELIDNLSEISGKRNVKLIMPNWFINIVSPLMEKYSLYKKERPLFTPYSIRVLHSNGNFSHAKASKELNYNPRSLKETLRDTIEWLNEK